MKETLLTINNLSKNYHTKHSEIEAIKNISFDLYKDEILGIVGPSGCGKSTLLSILANLEEKSSGEIKTNKDYKVGYMLQTDSLFPWLTILDNALIGLEIEKQKTDKNTKNVLDLLKKYGLYEFKNQYPNNLSGGMRQRVLWMRWRHR